MNDLNMISLADVTTKLISTDGHAIVPDNKLHKTSIFNYDCEYDDCGVDMTFSDGDGYGYGYGGDGYRQGDGFHPYLCHSGNGYGDGHGDSDGDGYGYGQDGIFSYGYSA